MALSHHAGDFIETQAGMSCDYRHLGTSYVPLKWWYTSIRLHSIMSQMIIVLIFTTVITLVVKILSSVYSVGTLCYC